MLNNKKRKVLVFIDWYLPGFKAGGPIRSCANMVGRMEEHFHFKVFTGNSDLGESIPYSEVITDAWNTLPGGEEVFYSSAAFRSHANIEKLIRAEAPDVIYLNSMFSKWFTLVPLMIAKKYGKAKVVIAPRGMLSPGALGIKSGKKRIFLSFSKMLRLFNGVRWHASTEVEVGEIKKMFGHHVDVIHAMNLTPLPEQALPPASKNADELRLVYIGRISLVKNTLQSIESLAFLKGNCRVKYDIYGPHDDAEYLQKCKDAAGALPENVKVEFKGPIKNSSVTEVLRQAHFMFMLTFNENFGHAIAEALSAGRPVIISDRTPWRELEKARCGWDLDILQPATIAKALTQACEMQQEEYNAWSESAATYSLNVIRNNVHVERTIDLFS